MTLSRLCFDDTSSTNGVWQNDPLVACRRCGMKAIMGRRRRFERMRRAVPPLLGHKKRAWCDTSNLDQDHMRVGGGRRGRGGGVHLEGLECRPAVRYTRGLCCKRLRLLPVLEVLQRHNVRSSVADRPAHMCTRTCTHTNGRARASART